MKNEEISIKLPISTSEYKKIMKNTAYSTPSPLSIRREDHSMDLCDP